MIFALTTEYDISKKRTCLITSVSGEQLNDDDHRFDLSELYLKKLCVRIELHGARCGGKFN